MATDFAQALADPRGSLGDPVTVLREDDLTIEQKRQVLDRWFELAKSDISGTGRDGWAGEQSELERVRAAIQQIEALG